MPPDCDLLRQYADHRDEAAFAEVVRRHLGLVYATAVRLLSGDTHLAQDVTQTVFTDLARSAAALRHHPTVAGWLHTSARFHASKTVRTERRRRAREQEAIAMTDHDTPADENFWAQLCPLLDDAVAQLNDADRDALLLRYFEGKTHREVAATLNLNEDAARMRVERALEKLRAQFSKRGVATTAALLATTLGVHGATPAPAAFAASVAAKSLAAAAGAGAGLWALLSLKTRLVGVAVAVVATLTIFLLWPHKPTRPASLALVAPLPVTPTPPPLPDLTLPPGPPPNPPPTVNTTATSLALAVLLPVASLAADFTAATTATNQLGLELFQGVSTGTPGGNVLISPFSIQSALAMTYAGADGDTRAEMARVLHYPADDVPLAASFGMLRDALDATVKNSVALAASRTGTGRKTDPIEWHMVNRLFGQTGYEFREPFLAIARDSYGAPLELVDFKTDWELARVKINAWVEKQTVKKISDLIPPKGVDPTTRLVLVNALYLKAPWQTPFSKGLTEDLEFQVRGNTPTMVPTMRQITDFGFAKRDGYTAVILPYLGGDLQLLILLPDAPDVMAAFAARVTPELLRDCAKLSPRRVNLFLPKFRLDRATDLKETLRALGMKTAFDLPRGSANFDRMAPRKPDDYLYIWQVFHKTFLDLDEEGTTAAAATAVVVNRRSGGPPPTPVEVHVDHPFIFAIQHRESGACLFLGRVTDPR